MDGPFNPDSFRDRLGPKSREAWAALLEGWYGTPDLSTAAERVKTYPRSMTHEELS